MWRRSLVRTVGLVVSLVALCGAAVAQTGFSRVNLKAGVRAETLHPGLYALEPLLLETWRTCKAGAPTITAGTDGRHRENSYHYVGKAIDIRLNDVGSKTRACLVEILRHKLDALETLPFVLILEGQDGDPNIHLHLHIDDGDRLTFYKATPSTWPG